MPFILSLSEAKLSEAQRLIRILDKQVDELAKGRAMERILRT